MIFGIFKSMKKSKKLVQYSKILSELDLGNGEEEALQGIIDLAFEDANNAPTIKKHKITREKMEKKYQELVIHGAGQIAGDHWVAASALVYAQTLDYIFDKSNNKMTRDSGGAVAYALIEYFEQGKTGKVSE